MPDAHLRVFRGSPGEPGHYDEFDVPVEEGMVVLDALHWIQGHEAPDLAVRWNCKAAKCGSCSAEVDGRPSLTCKTRLSDFDLEQPITVEPMRAFPLIRDLVTDVSWNYEVNKTIQPFTPPADQPQEEWRWQQEDIERVQEFRKCIECFLCQDVCHVLRNHETEQPFMGPRFLVRAAGLEMHPIDQADRTAVPQGRGRHRLLQHHEVLHRGLPGAHQDHRQRDHPAQGARRRQVLRPDPDGLAEAARRRVEPTADGRPPGCRRPADGASRAPAAAPPSDGAPSESASDTPPADPLADGEPTPTERRRAALARAASSSAPTARPAATRSGLGRGGAVSTSRGPMPATRGPSRTRRSRRILGVQTNNVAEYTGVVRALELARELGAREVACCSTRSSSSSSSPAAGGSRTRS